ncbi:hypothetical protein FACS1894176_00740 [Bacteroidia bacterium]|nr:hypothetical protein FACS1894176_00740 [Bacteroidia bacterium]
MLSFLSGFLIFNLLYHVFATRTVFGLELWSASMTAFIREGLWCLFIAAVFLVHIKQWKAYRNIWKRSWISLGGLLVFSVAVSYLGMEKGRGDILIGIKY